MLEPSFLWSCGGSGTTPGHSCWNVTNDYYSDVPTEMWSGEIPSAWTVTIDTRTAVLNKLTVRGNLIFQTNGGPDIELRAHYIDVRGGRLIMGNASHPILPGTIATLTLHGDRYKKVHDATLPACDKCRVENDKLLALNGNFSVHGTPVIAWARLARHAFAGDRVIELDAPNASAAGWRIGDELMMTTSRPHLDQKYGGKENMGAHKTSNFGGSEYEYHTIARVNVSESGNRLVVTLAAPLTQDHIGENFTLTDEQRGPLPANRSRVDMRAAVGHITRNAVVRGGATSTFDEWSGMTVQEQHYGGYIDINPGYESPKFGYDETMSCYLLDPTNLDSCRELLPDGHVSFEFAEFQRIGRGCFFGCSNQGTGIRFQGVTSGARRCAADAARPALVRRDADEFVISALGEGARSWTTSCLAQRGSSAARWGRTTS